MNQLLSNEPHQPQGHRVVAIFFALGAMLMVLIGSILVFVVLITQAFIETTEQLSILMLAGGMIAIGLLLLPGFYVNSKFSLIKPLFYDIALTIHDQYFLPGSLVSWFFFIFIGSLLTKNQTLSFIFLPVINVISVCIPIIILLRVSLRRIQLPSSRRMWTIFGASLIITPILSFILEGLVLAIFMGGYLLLAKFNPVIKTQLSTILSIIQTQNSNSDQNMRSLANILFSPLFLTFALVIFSIAIPTIEELFKIILLWGFRFKSSSPKDGFVLGALCGAAFALVENICFSSTGSDDWTTSVVIRASAALPHIFNSGILGWALFSARENKRYWQFSKTFLTVTLIHGAWNAISLGLVITNFSLYVPNAPFFLQSPFPWISGWLVLVIGIFSGLIISNTQMRKTITQIELTS